jgi:hypothetical protein
VEGHIDKFAPSAYANHDPLEGFSEDRLPIDYSRAFTGPESGEIFRESHDGLVLQLRQIASVVRIEALQVALQLPQFPEPLLPRGFELARNQPILGLDERMLTLCAPGFEAGPLDALNPQLTLGLPLTANPLLGRERNLQACGRECSQEVSRDMLIEH